MEVITRDSPQDSLYTLVFDVTISIAPNICHCAPQYREFTEWTTAAVPAPSVTCDVRWWIFIFSWYGPSYNERFVGLHHLQQTRPRLMSHGPSVESLLVRWDSKMWWTSHPTAQRRSVDTFLTKQAEPTPCLRGLTLETNIRQRSGPERERFHGGEVEGSLVTLSAGYVSAAAESSVWHPSNN